MTSDGTCAGAEAEDQPLSADVPRMLHHVFDADMRHLLRREKLTTNLTCMQPELSGIEAAAHNINYVLDDSTMAELPLVEGRKCQKGRCCDACSRNVFPTFATPAETDLETFPGLAQFTFNDLETVAASTILQFVRLIERVRRAIAHEYGLPLAHVLSVQAYSRKYVAGTTQTGGGGSEGDSVTLHTDEETHGNYHYSSVIYLNTQGEDFEGGDFIFNDPRTDGDDAEDADDEEPPPRGAAAPAEDAAAADADDEVWLLGDEVDRCEDDQREAAANGEFLDHGLN